jgi:hypothetical protein
VRLNDENILAINNSAYRINGNINNKRQQKQLKPSG